jgi:glycosyltransferase involved in cell wall biosynthesis
MNKVKLSVVLATRNEEKNIEMCLSSVKNISDEIIVVDEYSTDSTVKIAEKFGAKTYKRYWKMNFHENKQFAIEKATGDWILQLDADERVTKDLAIEIVSVLNGEHTNFIANHISKDVNDRKRHLFEKHQRLIEEREGGLGKETGEIVAYFVPRLNFFLGKAMRYAGKYPDGVIRLIKAGCARLPAKSVHELMEVDGEVGWLFNDLEHHEYPSLKSYIVRMNRYTDYQAKELKQKAVPRNILYLYLYTIHKPLFTFLKLYFRNLGFLNGMHGFLWSAFSALHFPIAYYKYWQTKNS